MLAKAGGPKAVDSLVSGEAGSASSGATATPMTAAAQVHPTSALAAGDDPLQGPDMARLIAQAQGGDPAAFERLIATYQAKIYGFARAYCGDPQEASDLAQEALIKIYRSLGGFRFQSSLLTWMFRIVKNVAVDHYRSRRHREKRREQPIDGTTETELRGSRSGEYDPEGHLLADETRQAVWTALDRVPEVYRTVVVLADMQGLSYEEVAVIVGTPVGTVKSRLNRGRDALRDALVGQQGLLARSTKRGRV